MSPLIVKVVGDIYACLLDEVPTSTALDVLCSAIGATHAVVMSKGSHGDGFFAASLSLAEVSPSSFSNIGQSDEYARLKGNASSGSAARMTDVIPRVAILETEVYQRTLRHIDGGLAVVGCQYDGLDIWQTAICRSAAIDPDFEDDDVELLRIALPHLVAVTSIASRIMSEQRSGRRARSALDVVEDSVITLNNAGQILHANLAAEALLVSGDRIRRTRGRIAATDPDDDRKLQCAIMSAQRFNRGFDAHDKALASTLPFQVLIGRRTLGWPLIATVLPADQTREWAENSAILLHLRDPARTSCLSMTALRAEWGLTHREATLVTHLAAGTSLVAAAGQMEISTGTARQYLKTVFQKTGVGGQAELLRLVAR